MSYSSAIHALCFFIRRMQSETFHIWNFYLFLLRKGVRESSLENTFGKLGHSTYTIGPHSFGALTLKIDLLVRVFSLSV